MLTLVIYIPETHLEQVKDALFAAGAGRYEQYDCCSWEVKGTGQFRPLEGSDPFMGQQGEIERVSEYRVEMICREDRIDDVLAALREVHPYEEPAFMVLQNLAFPAADTPTATRDACPR